MVGLQADQGSKYPTMAVLAYGTAWFAVTSRRSIAREVWPAVPAEVRRAVRGRSFAFLGGIALLVGYLVTLESPWASAEVFVVSEPVVSAKKPQVTARYTCHATGEQLRGAAASPRSIARAPLPFPEQQL